MRQNKDIYTKKLKLLSFQENNLHTSAGFFTLLFMKRLFMVLGLVTAAFFTVFLDSGPFAPPFPANKKNKQTQMCFHRSDI